MDRLVVSTSPAPPEFLASFLPAGVRVIRCGSADLVDAVAEAEIVVGDWKHEVLVSAEVIARASRCRLIQQPSAGFENIDIVAAAAAGIPVANAGPANASAVAEHAVLLALACLRQLPDAMDEARAGGWDQQDWLDRDLPELRERNVGILGLGAVGGEAARLFRAFGCAVRYHKRTPLDAAAEAALGATHASLDELLTGSDLLVVCLPLNDQTSGLLDEARLRTMPRGAVIVNVARGGLIDHAALATLLRSGHLAGAGLDVYPVEPAPPGHEVANLPRVVLTPHIGGVTAAAKRRILVNSLGNVARVLAGEDPLYVVNAPLAAAGPRG